MFVEATDSYIRVALDLNINNGGTPITMYSLEINDGLDGSVYTPVLGYS